LRQEHDFRHPHDGEEEDLAPSQKSWTPKDTVSAVVLFKAYHYGGMSVIHEMMPESRQRASDFPRAEPLIGRHNGVG
jgi:hypothetical protein